MHLRYNYNECVHHANEESLPSPILERRKLFNLRKAENDLSASQLVTGIMQPIENKRFRFGKVSWSQFTRDCIKVQGIVSRYKGLYQGTRDCIKVQGIVSRYKGMYQGTRDCIKVQGIVSRYKGLYQGTRDCIKVQGIVSRCWAPYATSIYISSYTVRLRNMTCEKDQVSAVK